MSPEQASLREVPAAAGTPELSSTVLLVTVAVAAVHFAQEAVRASGVVLQPSSSSSVDQAVVVRRLGIRVLERRCPVPVLEVPVVLCLARRYL